MLAWLRALPIRRKEAHIYRTGIFSHLPGGRSALPGHGTPITLTDCFEPESGTDIGALINVVQHTVTVVLTVSSHDQASLPQEIIDGRVAGWGTFLRIVAEHGDIAGLAVVTETSPETGASHRGHIESRRSPHAPALAAELLDEWIDDLAVDTLRVNQRIALTFRHSAGTFRDGLASVSRRLPELRGAVIAAGLRADWATSPEIIAFTKAAFNPAAAEQIDQLLAERGDTGLRWEDAGPAYHQDEHSYYLHDSARSMTYRCYEFPVQPVDENSLARVIGRNTNCPYKRSTLIYRLHRPSDAKELADSQYRDGYAAAQQTTRGLVDAAKQMRFEDLAATREELAEGHGLVDVGMLVTVTVSYDDNGRDAAQAVKDAGVASSLEFAPCWTDQAVSFLAALGIGVYPDMDESIGGISALGS